MPPARTLQITTNSISARFPPWLRVTVFPSGTPGMKQAYHRAFVQPHWAPVAWSAISLRTARCGAPIKPPHSSQTESRDLYGISDYGNSPRATAVSYTHLRAHE